MIIDNISSKIKKIAIIGIVLGLIGAIADILLGLEHRASLNLNEYGMIESTSGLPWFLSFMFGPIVKVEMFKLSITNVVAFLIGFKWIKETLAKKIFYGLLTGLLVLVFGLLVGGFIVYMLTIPGISQ